MKLSQSMVFFELDLLYVIEKFIGSVKGNTVRLNEYEVIDSKLNPNANFTAWCVKSVDVSIMNNIYWVFIQIFICIYFNLSFFC